MDRAEREVVTVSHNLTNWLASGERGTSSNAIFTHLTGVHAMGRWGKRSHPLDPDDLSRCRKLLEECPELQLQFHRMAEVSPIWAKLVENWESLCALMDTESPEWRKGKGAAPKTYDRMQELGC